MAGAQTVYGILGGERRVFNLPEPGAEVLPGIAWGQFDSLFTPAFWASQVWAECDLARPVSHRLGDSLREEVAACLLGGYGMPAEIGLAAFERLKSGGLLRPGASHDAIRAALSVPLLVNGRSVRYRFSSIKAEFLFRSMAVLDREEPSSTLSDQAYRDWLTQLPGVGLKTASWITRNIRDSDAVAILDIHIDRACRIARIFPQGKTIARHYRELEVQFLSFCSVVQVRCSLMDAVMWDFMRRVGSLAFSALESRAT